VVSVFHVKEQSTKNQAQNINRRSLRISLPLSYL